MKFPLVKLSIFLLMLVVVIPMIMPGPNGTPVMRPSDWLPDIAAVKTLPARLERWFDGLGQASSGSKSGQSGSFYKWQDENGKWHFSDQAPPEGTGETVETLPKLTNTLQAVEPAKQSSLSTSSQASLPTIPLPTTIPVDKIPKLIDDAKNVQHLAEERREQLDSMP